RRQAAHVTRGVDVQEVRLARQRSVDLRLLVVPGIASRVIVVLRMVVIGQSRQRTVISYTTTSGAANVLDGLVGVVVRLGNGIIDRSINVILNARLCIPLYSSHQLSLGVVETVK